jgi:chaperonin cofactor prefoldin
MQKENEEVLEEIEDNQDILQKYLGLSLKSFLILVFIVILAGIYIGTILYGKNSINVLIKLQTYESFLKDDIKRYKEENAKLQKDYFELKEISSTSESGN